MKKSLLLISAIIVLEAIAGCSSQINFKPPSIQSASDSTVEVADAEPFSYEDYAKVLQYVSDRGLVNYEGLQANRQQLDRFNQSLGAVSPQTYASWNEAEQIAFLNNAYNALTLQSIIDRDPLL